MKPTAFLVAWAVAALAGLHSALEADLLTAAVRGAAVWVAALLLWVFATKAIERVLKFEVKNAAGDRPSDTLQPSVVDEEEG